MLWQTSRFQIDLTSPKIMGIVNLTPDSFSDGGKLGDVRAAMQHAEQLIQDGAHILDLGAESSRPGAPPVSLEEELARLLPVLREAVKLNVPISVDTYKPQVMQAALDAGADIINDIWGFRQIVTHLDAALSSAQVVVQHGSCGLVMMHMHRDPQTMQLQPMTETEDVVQRVKSDLLSFYEQLAQIPCRPEANSALKIALKNRLLIDPGIGFGKTAQQNFTLLARQRELLELGYPLLAGWSRKSSLGAVTGIEAASERVTPSVAAALLAVERGASVVRVHDVRETAQALKVWQAAHPSLLSK
jgi:dihydropteroate synthase